jgi:hypothetical protein
METTDDMYSAGRFTGSWKLITFAVRENTIRYIAVLTFLLIVGVCSANSISYVITLIHHLC